MALQKRIDELDAATQVNSTDMFAVAQSGSNEAVRATTSQIADAVKELNETGALSELTYATSQGKNLLAQVLTNKGVQTSPSETLIQMADKVNSLDAMNTGSLIIGELPATTCTLGSSDIAVAQTSKDTFFLLYGSTLYAYTPVGNGKRYIADVLANADASINLSSYLSGTAPYYVIVSQNGEYVMAADYVTNSSPSYAVLHYDYTNHTFEVLYNGTFPWQMASLSSPSYHEGWALSNDGTHIIGGKPTTYTQYISYYNFAKNISNTQVRVWTYSYVPNGNTCNLILKDNYIYMSATGGGGTSNTLKCAYTIDESTGDITTDYQHAIYGSAAARLDPKTMIGLNFGWNITVSSNAAANGCAKMWFTVVDLESPTLYSISTKTLPAFATDVSTGVLTPDEYWFSRGALRFCVEISAEDDVVTFKPLCGPSFSYNRTTKAFSYSKTNMYAVSGRLDTGNSFSTNGLYTYNSGFIMDKSEDDEYIYICGMVRPGKFTSGASVQFLNGLKLRKNQCIAIKRTVNGNTYYWGVYDSHQNATNVASGLFDVQTTVVPSVPDN